jgi:hypothetical protein
MVFSVVGSSVSAVDVPKTATVTIQGGALDLTVANDIDFGTTTLDGSAKTLPNIEASNLILVEDNLGDSQGWEVNLTLGALNNGGTALSSATYDFDPVGADLLGTGTTPGAIQTGVASGAPILVFSGTSASTVSNSIDLKAGFLDLHFNQNELPGTYTGTATFSLTTTP